MCADSHVFEHSIESGGSKRSSGEAAAEGDTTGVALGYVEDVGEVRTKQGTVFSRR
jgi:hypothetical protein